MTLWANFYNVIISSELVLAPSAHFRFFCLFVYFLKTEIMFLRFGLPYVHMHVSSKNGHRKKRIFSKCSLKQTYLKTQAYRFRGWSHTDLIQDMPCNFFDRISFVLVFFCGRVKTMKIRYVWTRTFSANEEKYPDMCGWGFSLSK